MKGSVAPSTINLNAHSEIEFAADRAILLALIVNELVFNSAKYAYVNGGPIEVSVSQTDDKSISVSVRDDGVGIPDSFDVTKSKRLGTRLVSALSKQLGAELMRPATAGGTTFTLIVPKDSDSAKGV